MQTFENPKNEAPDLYNFVILNLNQTKKWHELTTLIKIRSFVIVSQIKVKFRTDLLKFLSEKTKYKKMCTNALTDLYQTNFSLKTKIVYLFCQSRHHFAV